MYSELKGVKKGKRGGLCVLINNTSSSSWVMSGNGMVYMMMHI